MRDDKTMNKFSGFWLCHNCQSAEQHSPKEWPYNGSRRGCQTCHKAELTPLLDKEVVYYLTKYLKNRQIARDFFQSIQI